MALAQTYVIVGTRERINGVVIWAVNFSVLNPNVRMQCVIDSALYCVV